MESKEAMTCQCPYCELKAENERLRELLKGADPTVQALEELLGSDRVAVQAFSFVVGQNNDDFVNGVNHAVGALRRQYAELVQRKAIAQAGGFTDDGS